VKSARWTNGSRQRTARRARWRSRVVWCVVTALVWPALGTLPWVAAEEFEPAHHAASHHASDSAGEALSETHGHHDASEIPGSPTHPADHDCFQCQVFKHLSRCALVLQQVPTVALPAGCPVRPVARAESQHEIHQIAALPPVRGPPSFLG